MKIGILQCGHAAPEVTAEHGDYSDMFQRLLSGHGFSYQTWDVVDMQFPDSIHAADGWLLSGSRHGAYEDLPFIPPLEDFIRAAFGAHVPMVGVCFGHQIIAQALGGRVEKFDRGWAIGHHTYDFEGLGEVSLNAWHQDQVIDLPEGARVVAGNEFCKHAALVYGRRAYTVQPHPEFASPLIGEYLDLRKGTENYPDAVLDAAAQRLFHPVDSSALGDEIARFFRTSKEAHDGKLD